LHSSRYRPAAAREFDGATPGRRRWCSDTQRWNDGAYLIGALTVPERHVYERHLAACPCCRTNIRRLAGLPGLLMRVREQGWADPTGVVDSGNLPLADERIGREG
jgi:hypothetical protein